MRTLTWGSVTIERLGYRFTSWGATLCVTFCVDRTLKERHAYTLDNLFGMVSCLSRLRALACFS